MGGAHSKDVVLNEISDSESDSEFFQVDTSRMNKKRMPPDRYETDAALRNLNNPIPRVVLTTDAIETIEKQLEVDEIVSLTYLLYDRAEIALQYLQSFLVGGKHNLLSEWASSEQRSLNIWQDKFVEALCIVQNYQILRQLGFQKQNLQTQYLPHRPEASVAIDKKRKSLYLLAERMDDVETERFLKKMKTALLDHRLPFQMFDESYLELYFLHWEQNEVNNDYIRTSLKFMGSEELSDMITEFSERPLQSMLAQHADKIVPIRRPEKTMRDTTFLVSNDYASCSYDPLASGPSLITTQVLNDDRYDIDPNNPGLVLIVNQVDFYTELSPEYEHLLHEQNAFQKLQERSGTQKDKDRIEDIFKNKFGFRVVIKENIAHYSVIKFIEDEVSKITNESSLIVCIMSHGEKGVIYGSNSCKVDVSKIINIMKKKNPKLIGRPKVLILQSCQGSNCQKKDESSDDETNDYVRDGPAPSKAADFLTVWATIPGYAAIRNVNNGSWLIQTLCDEIESMASRCHLLDICTRVNNKISTKEWKEANSVNIMTPEVHSTLRKSFYLPALKN